MPAAKKPAAKSSRDKVRAHRAKLRASGLRPVTFWVPDTRTPEFAEQARRASLAMNAADARDEELWAFLDSVTDELLADVEAAERKAKA
jgi:hypothetical protein